MGRLPASNFFWGPSPQFPLSLRPWSAVYLHISTYSITYRLYNLYTRPTCGYYTAKP